MVELLSSEQLESKDYQDIRTEFCNLWFKLFLSKDKIDRVILRRYKKLWFLIYGMSHTPLASLPFVPKVYGSALNSELILRSNQLWMPRCWEYPWAILKTKPSSKKVLDVGSGWSMFPLYLAQHNQVDATDIDSRQMNEISPMLADILKVKVNYQVADVASLPMSDDTYDYSYAISTLEHIPHGRVHIAINELLRVTKPQGNVILTLDYDVTGKGKESFNYQEMIDIIRKYERYLVNKSVNLHDIWYNGTYISELKNLWKKYFPYEVPNTDGSVVGIMLSK